MIEDSSRSIYAYLLEETPRWRGLSVQVGRQDAAPEHEER